MPRKFHGLAAALTVTASIVLVSGLPTASAAETENICATDGPYSVSGVAVEICLIAPANPTISGTVPVTATMTNVGTPTSPLSTFGARRMVFTLDGKPLLTDFEAPYTFQLPSATFLDGEHTLGVSALLRDSFTDVLNYATPALTTTLHFDNNVDTPPVNTRTFEATGGRPASAGESFVVAATGDGASGEPEADAVSDLIDSWNPNLALYLGDVYENGTPTEFLNWYGDDESLWGRFRDVTHPTLGNHEVEGGVAEGYFDYWDNVPDYYSFDANGWHIATINSNSYFQQTDPGTPQYEWLREDLAASAANCTAVYFHHPVWSIGTQGDTERLNAIWDLMVGSGVDLVLTGHEHNYQRWQPLDADGVPHPAGATQFVIGTGGHGIRPFVTSDPRVVTGFDTYRDPAAHGALRLELGSRSATFEYVTHEGVTLDAGDVDCHDARFEPGSVRNRIYLERVALDAILAGGTTGGADKIRDALSHLDVALGDILWSTDLRPADRDGHKVVDELKKAVHEILDAPQAPALDASMQRLTKLGSELAESAIAEARASYGELGELAAAVKEQDAAFVAQSAQKYEEALDKFKKAFEHARKSTAAAPAPWTSGVGIRGGIGDQLASIWAKVPSGVGSDDDRLKKAVEQLTAALDPLLWETETRPDTSSDAKVPDRLKRSIEELQDIRNIDVQPQMNDIARLTEGLALNAIAEAVARGGKAGDIAEAEKKLDEGRSLLLSGRFRDAADAFKKAFEKARGA